MPSVMSFRGSRSMDGAESVEEEGAAWGTVRRLRGDECEGRDRKREALKWRLVGGLR